MRIEHTRDRNDELKRTLPSVGDQLDAMWAILYSMNPSAVEASPVYQAIQEMKYSRFPKVPVQRQVTLPTVAVSRGADSPTGNRTIANTPEVHRGKP